MNNTLDQPISMLKVDGGACENNFLMQYQADLLGILQNHANFGT
jgi:glycerol kinase